MNSDLLLTWMTHLGEGSWMSFRRAAEEMASGDRDPLGPVPQTESGVFGPRLHRFLCGWH